ncbi:antimicrobial peptide 1-like isoform X2 [Agrilus planipennis]|uniref:Antimicrobial peptide 1-like isoform X2 n=1 Tax=Agrilus planipennis TaxID=224129 RepID=A0A1W4WAT5_AGRPL|nr:antimicrobial peptide 1-like isoform X2 [Agrilus planipennis]
MFINDVDVTESATIKASVLASQLSFANAWQNSNSSSNCQFDFIKMKFFNVFFIVIIAILGLQQSVMACIRDRDGCQPDGRQGNCCSGYCHKQPGWVAGYCKRR